MFFLFPVAPEPPVAGERQAQRGAVAPHLVPAARLRAALEERVAAVHGEARHQLANAKLALTCQVGQALAPGDGDVIRLREGQEAEIVQRLELDVFGLDGSRLIPWPVSHMR